MPVSQLLRELAPQTGTAIVLRAGERLRIVDPEGQQVADLAFFALADPHDSFSPGRTIDYNERLIPKIGDVLYSHRSTPLVRVVADTVGVHDMLLAPCSRIMFERRGESNHPSCHENLYRALEPFGLTSDDVTATLNVFMDVRVERNSIRVHPPASNPGDSFEIEAQIDCIAGITACSSELTNAGRCKPIQFRAG